MNWNDEMKTHHLFKSQDSKPCEVKTQQMSRGIDGLHIKQNMATLTTRAKKHHNHYAFVMLLETSFRNCTQTSSAFILGLERVYQQKDYRLMEIQ